jgi:hypothetical protein
MEPVHSWADAQLLLCCLCDRRPCVLRVGVLAVCMCIIHGIGCFCTACGQGSVITAPLRFPTSPLCYSPRSMSPEKLSQAWLGCTCIPFARWLRTAVCCTAGSSHLIWQCHWSTCTAVHCWAGSLCFVPAAERALSAHGNGCDAASSPPDSPAQYCIAQHCVTTVLPCQCCLDDMPLLYAAHSMSHQCAVLMPRLVVPAAGFSWSASAAPPMQWPVCLQALGKGWLPSWLATALSG